MTTAAPGEEANDSTSLELDDRVRLLMLGIVGLLLLLLVALSISGVRIADANSTSAKPAAMSLADAQMFCIAIGFVIVFALASSLFDWRYQLLAAAISVIVALLNRGNENLKASARTHMAKELPTIDNRQILLLRGLLVVMTGALVALVVQTGGWVVSPYTQYAITVFLLSMLLTDIFLGRLSLAGLGVIWIVAVFLAGGLEQYRYDVTSATLRWLTFLNFGIQLFAVAMASQTFEVGGLIERRQTRRAANSTDVG